MHKGELVTGVLDRLFPKKAQRRRQERETLERVAKARAEINERNTQLIEQGKRPVILGEEGSYGFF